MHWLKILELLREEQRVQETERPRLQIPVPHYHQEEIPRFEEPAPEIERGTAVIDYTIQKN
tara:strand:- start:256 stop:438 length:183 start_codon:yes stop_codon:yes gene_type:complete